MAITAGTTSTSTSGGGSAGCAPPAGEGGGIDYSGPRPHAQVLSQRGADAIVLLSLINGRYYTLEGVGARAWELFDGTRPQHEVAMMISQEYGVALDRVKADLAALIDDLDSEELLAPRG